MKVIFLDFDGVLLTARTMLANLYPHKGSACHSFPDPVLGSLLVKVCLHGGVRIVVSSTWRHDSKGVARILADIGLLKFLYGAQNFQFDWKTGEEKTGESRTSRPREIAAWLKAHPEVTDYRILDDDSFFWTPYQRRRWLKCCSHDGAGFKVMHELLKWAGLLRSQRKN